MSYLQSLSVQSVFNGVSSGTGQAVLIAGAIAAVLGWQVYKNYEAPADVARKPEAIASAVERTLKNCETQKNYPQTMPYANRVQGILQKSFTAAIEKLNTLNVTICLDQRLSHLDEGIFDRSVMGTYYPNTAIGPVVTIWDDGNPYKHGEWFKANAVSQRSEVIDTLASKIENTSFAADGPMYAGTYGKYKYTDWSNASYHSDAQVLAVQKAPLLRP